MIIQVSLKQTNYKNTKKVAIFKQIINKKGDSSVGVPLYKLKIKIALCATTLPSLEGCHEVAGYVFQFSIFTFLEQVAQADKDAGSGRFHIVALVEVEEAHAIATKDTECLEL